MALKSLKAVGTAIADNGKCWQSFIHKTSGLTSFEAGSWLDMSMMAGTPKYNAYVGGQLVATPFEGVGNAGIYVPPGGNRYINRLGVETAQAQLFMLLADYLMAYPLIDGDDTDLQEMDNTLGLTRYQDGAGVQCMLVCTTPMAGDGNVTVTYTNQDGVTGQQVTFGVRSPTAVGNIICGADTSAGAGKKSPFMPLAAGDTGIRAIERIQNLSGLGGFYAAVLVKPLAQIQTREASVPAEVYMHQYGLVYPEVKQGAYLNYLTLIPGAGALSVVRGFVEFFW